MSTLGVVLVDIDGTVALHHNPDGSLRRGHYEYEKVGSDLPNQPIIELVLMFLLGPFEVVFLSGREDSCRMLTLEWLDKYVLPGRSMPQLFMRATGDGQPDDIIKRELYEAHILPRKVLYVLEDRDRCIRLWRSLGLTALQVADGNF